MHPAKITRRLSVLILIIIVCISVGISQSIESVKNTLREYHYQPASLERDSILIHNYNYLAEAYSGRKDSLALLYIDSISQLLRSTSWSKATGLYHRAQGKYHDRRGEFQNALDAYTRSIEAFEAADDKSDYIAYTGILKAFVLNNNGLPDECEKELEKIRPIAEQLENKNYLAWIIDAFGDHYFYSSFGRQDIKKALEYYKKVEALLPQVRNKMIIADNAHCLSGCYLRLGQEELALKYRDQALQIAEVNGFQNIIFAVYGDMADVYSEREDFKEAIKYRQLSLQYAHQADWIEMEARAENMMAYTYKLSGDFEQALTHYERYQAIEDSLSRFQVQSRYAELQTRYEAEKKDLEIERLKANQLTLIRNVLLFLLLCGIGFFTYYLRVNKKLKKQNISLLQKNKEIQMALTEGQNLERKRMAIELHDNINAKIAATKWMLESLTSDVRPEKEKALIQSVINSITEIYEDVRFISHNLVPKEIETKSLDVVVAQLISNLNQNQRIRFSYSSNGKQSKLTEYIKLHSYSIIMELINNIIRHSGCKSAVVSLVFSDSSVIIDVRDDGTGFDPNAENSGAGLKNIKARVSSLNGNFQIETNVPNGSHIKITLPLAEHFEPAH